MASERLDVGDQMPGGVLLQAGVRGALAGATLIQEDNAVAPRIKKFAVPGVRTATGAAVQEDDRLAVRIARDLKVERVSPRHFELASLVRNNRRIAPGDGVFQRGFHG